MTQIVLTQEQADVLVQSSGFVTLCDPKGNEIVVLRRNSGFTDADIAEARRRIATNPPGRTTEQVMERLRSMEGK